MAAMLLSMVSCFDGFGEKKDDKAEEEEIIGTLTYTLSEDGSYYTVSGIEAGSEKAPTRVDIPAEYGGVPVKAIGKKAFVNNNALETVNIAEGIETIEESAFYGCYAIKKIVIPNTVKTIEKFAFQYCSSLVDLTIGNKVETIEVQAFCFAESLSTVTIPASVTYIGEGAFSYCKALKTATFEKADGWWVSTEENASSGETLNTGNPTENAVNLRMNYRGYHWRCTEQEAPTA